MAQNDTGQGLNLDIQHAVALCLGEIAHLCLGEFDIFKLARAERGDKRVDLCLCQAKRRRRIIVEFFGKRAHSRIATRLDIGKGRLDHCPYFGVVFLARLN